MRVSSIIRVSFQSSFVPPLFAAILTAGCTTPIPLYPEQRGGAPIVTAPSGAQAVPAKPSVPAATPANDDAAAVAMPVLPPGSADPPPAANAPTTAPSTPGAVSGATIRIDRIAGTVPPGPIALVLPLRSPDFARAAEAVRAGVVAARDTLAPSRDVKVYETDATRVNVLDVYREAVRAGVVAVIGPLTRTEVQAVAADVHITVPTVALNTVEGSIPPRMTALALNVENEARQAARVAFDEARGRNLSRMPTAVVVTGSTPLYKRAAQAFADGFFDAGGRVIDTIEAAADIAPAVPPRSRSAQPSVVFAALPATQAGALHASWREAPMIGVSTIDALDERVTMLDLEGVRVIDAPWLLARNDPALARFARVESSQRWSPELERLYALGIDAFRIALELARGNTRFELDGATGHLSVQGTRVERRAQVATIRDGDPVADAP